MALSYLLPTSSHLCMQESSDLIRMQHITVQLTVTVTVSSLHVKINHFIAYIHVDLSTPSFPGLYNIPFSLHADHVPFPHTRLIISAFFLILSLNLPVHQVLRCSLCFTLLYLGDFKRSQLSCLSSSVGSTLCLECVRHGFESHLSAAFSLEKLSQVLCCVALCCFVF